MTGPSRWTLYPGRSRLPDAAAPDLRGRSFRIYADVLLPTASDGGVLLSHGDRNGGYAVRVDDGRLVHDHVHAGTHSVARSSTPVPIGRSVCLEVRVERHGGSGAVRLLVDGVAAGTGVIPALARARTGYTGVDVGCDRGLTVGGYAPPARFTGELRCIEIEATDDQWLDEQAVMEIEGTTG
jgi:arylsulfatase